MLQYATPPCSTNSSAGAKTLLRLQSTKHRLTRDPAKSATSCTALQRLKDLTRRSMKSTKSPDQWSVMPSATPEPDQNELKKSPFIRVVAATTSSQVPDASQSHSRSELIQATVRSFHGVASLDNRIEASDYNATEPFPTNPKQNPSLYL